MYSTAPNGTAQGCDYGRERGNFQFGAARYVYTLQRNGRQWWGYGWRDTRHCVFRNTGTLNISRCGRDHVILFLFVKCKCIDILRAHFSTEWQSSSSLITPDIWGMNMLGFALCSLFTTTILCAGTQYISTSASTNTAQLSSSAACETANRGVMSFTQQTGWPCYKM